MTRKRNASPKWFIPGLAVAVVVALILVWQWPAMAGSAASPAQTAPARATSHDPVTSASQQAASVRQSGDGLNSADHVRVMVLLHGDTLVAQLQVDDGWHINANPASFDFLIPTQLSLQSRGKPVPTTVEYPQGRTIDLGLARPITVYSGQVRIKATLPDGAPATPLKAALRIQACSDDGRCLRPSIVKVPVLTGSSD